MLSPGTGVVPMTTTSWRGRSSVVSAERAAAVRRQPTIQVIAGDFFMELAGAILSQGGSAANGRSYPEALPAAVLQLMKNHPVMGL
jgi:hypothetical protein